MAGALTEELVSLLEVPSVTGDEQAIASTVARILEHSFPEARVWCEEVAPHRSNVLMRMGDPVVTLTSHLDTVPGVVPLHAADGRVWGRGACDAKGQVVAQIEAMRRACARGIRDLGCFYVVGEEIDSAGARTVAARREVGGRFVISGEPTQNRFVSRSWGVLELEASASGVQAHSSLRRPSALHTLVTDLAALVAADDSNWMVNVGRIFGGNATNVTAPAARATVGIRMRDASPDVLARVSALMPACDVRVLQVIEPMQFAVPEGVVDAVEVHFCSDARYYVGLFDAVMQFGPGDIAQAHTAEESLDVDELDQAAQILCALVIDLTAA